MRLASIKMAAIIVLFFLAAPIASSAQSFRSPGELATESLTAKSSDRKSAIGLGSLPREAQGPVASAFGNDDSRYWLRPSADGFRAENPGQALVAEFTKEGGEVESHNRRWGLVARAWGYGDRLDQLKVVEPEASANRVEYRRGGVTEWYENGPLGLEQGFTLRRRPGKANGQALTLELRLRGDLVAALEPGGKGLDLKDKDGKRALLYTGLSARDASGRELASWLEVRGERLLVRVEDERAQYPVVVDPWVRQAELTDAKLDALGTSVAVSGTTIVAGAEGAAYVFTKSGVTWSRQELPLPEGAIDFGHSVAVSGTTIVVGSPRQKVGSNPMQGAAYVFVQSGDGTWSQQAELAASDGAGGDEFASSVAFDGHTIVVGSPLRKVGSNSFQGAAYVFVQSGDGTWGQQAELTGLDGAANDEFGSSVACDGATIVVGATRAPIAVGSTEPGAAYVFVESGGTWGQQAELAASDGTAGNEFGGSVAVAGTTIVVGAPGPEFPAGPGAAYVFVESGGTWSQQAELAASDGASGDAFGQAVAVTGSTAVVGAPSHTVGSNLSEGAAYTFVESGGTWRQQSELTASDGLENWGFGSPVAFDGNTIVMGAFERAYVFSTPGTNQPVVQLVPPSIDFGDWAVDNTSSVRGVKLTNVGTGPLDITSITLSGSGDFAISSTTCGPRVAKGASCIVNVTFTPTMVGPETGTLTFADNDTFSGNPQTVALSGTGIVQAGLSPSSLDLGTQPVGFTSQPLFFSLDNNQTVPLTNIAISATGDFQVSTCATSLAPLSSCLIAVHFTPTAAGTRTGTLTVTDSATNSPQTATLKGTGLLQAALLPVNDAFGLIAIGTTSPAKTFTLTNNLPIALTNIAFSTTGDFHVSGTTCGTTLPAPSAFPPTKVFCKISVTFTPTAAGTRTGTFSVSDSANNSPQTATLKGKGFVAATLTPQSATFGSQAVGTTSVAKTLTLTNNQSVDLTNIAISTTGDFQVSETTCGTSLAAKSTCTINVTFRPTSNGTRTGTLSVSDGAANSPQTSALKGAGFVPATLTPARAAYPKQAVGTTSLPQTFTLTNHQSVELAGIVISTTGDFQVSATTCGTSLAAASSCTITATFLPTATGTRTGTLSVSDDAANAPQTSNLTGTGQ